MIMINNDANWNDEGINGNDNNNDGGAGGDDVEKKYYFVKPSVIKFYYLILHDNNIDNDINNCRYCDLLFF